METTVKYRRNYRFLGRTKSRRKKILVKTSRHFAWRVGIIDEVYLNLIVRLSRRKITTSLWILHWIILAFENYWIVLLKSPHHRPKESETRLVDPKKKMSGFVKIHANMDPKHRDRLAFIKLYLEHLKRNKPYYHVRLKKELKF
jgi:hypothetical protein